MVIAPVLNKIRLGIIDLTPHVTEQIFGDGFPSKPNKYPFVVGTVMDIPRITPPKVASQIKHYCYIPSQRYDKSFWGFESKGDANIFIKNYKPEVFYVNWD